MGGVWNHGKLRFDGWGRQGQSILAGLAGMPKAPRFAPNAVRVVELLAFPLVQLLDVTGPLQVFASANDFVLAAGGRPPYVLKVVAQSGAQVTASAGVRLSTVPLPLG